MKIYSKIILVLLFVGLFLVVYYNLPTETIGKINYVNNNFSNLNGFVNPQTNPSGVIFIPSQKMIYILPDNAVNKLQ